MQPLNLAYIISIWRMPTMTNQPIAPARQPGKLLKAFRAGMVRRWHSNPDLAATVDTLDAHQGRVARILLMLHPNPTADLLRVALTHDDGEAVVGDISGLTKAKHPETYALMQVLETKARADIWGQQPELMNANALWLRFADRLDALMWAQHHAPHKLSGDGWPEAIKWLINTAHILIPCNDTRRDIKKLIGGEK